MPPNADFSYGIWQQRNHREVLLLFFFLLPPFCKAELGGLNPLNLPAFSLVTPFYNCLLTYQLLRSLKLYLTPQFLDSGTLLALNKCLNE